MSAHYIPGEPPNRATEKEINEIDPSTSPACGEDRRRQSDIFPDTGGTMQDFVLASKAVAKILKSV